MKKPVKSNMYTFSLDTAWAEFATHVDGNKMGPLCVFSFHPLENPARAALRKSAESFGYGPDACLFLTACSSEKVILSPVQTLRVIEGIDPFRLVITDAEAAELCSQGYHRPVPFDECLTLLQRPVVAFCSFSSLIENEKGKQHAWKLLKKLLRTD